MKKSLENILFSTEGGHGAIERSSKELVRLHIGRNVRELLDSVVISLQVGNISQDGWLQMSVDVQQLVHQEINVGNLEIKTKYVN